MSVSKIKQPSDLWERCEGKLMVYVMEGISLVTKHGAGNPYVKLIYDKQKQKSQICKHAEDASWKELFLFDVVSEVAELELEVWTKSGLSDKMIGSCKVCVPPQLTPEELIDRVIDLELPANLKSKHKEVLDSRMGNIHLRMIYSREHEIPLRPPPNQCSNFYYRNHYKNMQTGDLIMYSGVGSTDAIAKLLSGTRYSRVGMVVRMPNKWTGKEKLFVFEVTRNLGKELDAFKDTATPGASLFRLFDHIHAVSAHTIWWVPLKMPLESASCANMVDWVKEVVARRITIDLPSIPPEVSELFERYELSLNKHPLASAEIASASAVASALRLGGKRLPLDQQHMSCVQLMSQDCFGDPIILRERSETPLPDFFTTAPESLARASSLSLRRATIHSANGSNGGDSVGANGHSPSIPGSSDNEIVAPKMRPMSVVAEPIRASSSTAMLRQDLSAPNHTFSSQHMNMAPDNGDQAVNIIQPVHPHEQHQQYQHQQYQHQQQYYHQNPSDANLVATQVNPPLYSPHPQQTDGSSDGVAQNGHSPSDIRGYRAPSKGPLPIAPPGPSIIGLPVYNPSANNGESNGATHVPLAPVSDDNLEESEGKTSAPPPSYDQATLGRGELTAASSDSPPPPPSSSHSVGHLEHQHQDKQDKRGEERKDPVVQENGHILREPSPSGNPAPTSHGDAVEPSEAETAPKVIIATTGPESNSVQSEGTIQKSPSGSKIADGPPPSVAPNKPKPKLMHREKSLEKGHKPLKSATSKPSALQAHVAGAKGDARDRAASSGAKPRLLPAPSGRNVTLPSNLLQTASNEDSPASTDASTPTKGTSTVPEINLSPPVGDAPGDEVISPRSKKSQRSPRESSKRSRASDHDGSTASSDTPPEKKRKKFKRQAAAANDEAGAPVTETATSVGQGPPPPVPEKKKKKVRSSRRPELTPAEAIRDDLDEGTKSELRKRRTGSVRILPQTEAAANWQAALEDNDAKSQETKPIVEEEPSTEPSPVVLNTFVPKTAMVLWTFDAMSENEITVTEGEQVLVLGVSEEWCLVESKGLRGAVPVSFLSMDSS